MKRNSKLPVFITASVLLLFPFSNLFHVLYPVVILGKSAWVTLPVLSIFCVYLWGIFNKTIAIDGRSMVAVLLIMASIIIFLFRESNYSDGVSYLDDRFIATSLLFMLSAYEISKNEFALRILTTAIVIQGVIVALVIIININFFPSVRIDTDVNGFAFLTQEGVRARDMLLGSSIAANQIVCSMFMLMVLIKYRYFNVNVTLFLLLQLLMLYGALLTVSRYPIMVAMLITILSFLTIGSFRKIIFYIVFFILVGKVALSLDEGIQLAFSNFIDRLSAGSEGRWDKLLLPIYLLSESMTSFIIGSGHGQVENAFSADGATISDNSYMLVALEFGVPFAIFYFFYVIKQLRKLVIDWISSLFFFYFIIALGVTNCILWESWMFVAIFDYYAISRLYKFSVLPLKDAGV